MKKLTTCVVAVTGFIGTSAFAADMGVPPAPSPAPVWNWTGWYAGVNVGASFGNAKTDFNVAPVTATLLFGTELGKNVTGPGVPFSDREYPDGFMGGGQIGYNWQFSPIWVVGLEADFQGALERDSANLNNPFSATTTFFSAGGVPISPATVTGTAVTDYTTKIEWFGTARVRIGYVWGNGDVMSYLTGG